MFRTEDKQWIDIIYMKIMEKMDAVSERSRYKIPYTTTDGVHDDWSQGRADGSWEKINWWTNGFWGGMMWLLYHAEHQEKYREIAIYSEEKLDQCLYGYYGLDHDIGFRWLPTAVADYRMTGNTESRKRGLMAADILAGRFNLAGSFIRAWNAMGETDTRGWAIIDCMMNLPILYWATEETDDPRYKHIAMAHADMAMKYFVREDGSVNHIVEFDPFSGEMVKSHGGQGYAEGSAWSRGQAWAVYGFYMSYRHTGKKEYLETARKAADYFIENVPENGVVPVDFRQPEMPQWEDSTAAAIAACGMIEISRACEDHAGQKYMEKAVELLRKLGDERCDWNADIDHLLINGSVSYHEKQHHQAIIYGDYYFIEAIFKLKGKDLYIW